MAQKENFFETENRYDRKKTSKYEPGDLIQMKLKNFAKDSGVNMVIFDKRQLHDKNGNYWVYDIMHTDTNHVMNNIQLVEDRNWIYTKLA